MTRLISVVVLLISFTSYGQSNKSECINTLDKIPYFIIHNIINLKESNDSVFMDFKILKSCGNLDSIDSELLTGPILGTMVIQLATDGKKATYRAIINSINELKKTAEYTKFRDVTIISKTLENKIVNINVIEQDRELLAKIGMSESDLDSFKIFIKNSIDENMTYKEAFTKYRSNTATPYVTKKIEYNKLKDIKTAIKEGKENDERVLIYFSGHACVNSRKMEDRILTDDQVENLLAEKFIFFVGYVDDKTMDKTSNSTIGQNIIKIQSDNFKTNSQPYFCVIDDNGKILSQIGYTNKVEDFIVFLNKGLK